MRARRWLLAIWFCFLVRAIFYCAALPLWEGYDEWSHFGVVERMAFRGEPLVARDSPLPRDTAATLEIVPLPWDLRDYALPPLRTTHFGGFLPPNAPAAKPHSVRSSRRGRSRTPRISRRTKDCKDPSTAGS